jgi:hypothetical protein
VIDVAGSFEIQSQIGVVENLTVVNNPLGAVFVGHRLCASGHVDNTEAEMAQSGEVVSINALTVGAAMADRFHHPAYDIFRNG